MTKFTKLFCTAFLLLAGFVSASAQDETFDLTADMFYQWDGYDADASSTGAADVDFNVGSELGSGAMVAGTGSVAYLIYADLTGCTKMLFEGTAGVQLRVLMNRQESNSGPLVEKNPTIGDDGTAELDLTEFAYVHLNAIKTGWGSPTGTITSIKLVKPSDPLAINKEQLKSAIGHAKMQSSFAKTEDSWNALQQAIADGETALANATDATSLDNAKDAIVNAEAGLTLLEGYSELTADMLFSWTGWDADAVKGNQAGCAYDLFKSTSMPYGDGSVIAFADLSAYDKLQIVSTGGTPRFLFNRDVNEGQWNENEAESHLIDNTKGDANSWHAKYFTQEGNVYTVNLAQLVADKGYAHLHSIKSVGGNVVVSGMYLYKAPAAEAVYTVAGNCTAIFGTEWDASNEANDLVKVKGSVYSKTFEGVELTNDYMVEYKIVVNHSWDESYGNNGKNADYTVWEGDGKYDVTFTFNAETKEVACEMTKIPEKHIVFPENAIVYDFEAAAAAGENPANKNGSAANGQAFYGWENEGKTDSKRQDYKGYEWAEGSVLPEECHIWRRSDRINGNVAGYGGLNCPSNKEMAIDGLEAGCKVIIVYDAENATDKEIIWAIGDGSSDETLEGPRATATINGVEAVTGETTIASGAEILVNSVTPAENGTGYIVFQVKKGMIIQQIAVIPAPDPLYVIGDANSWDLTQMTELPFDFATETYKYEINAEGDFYFAFSDKQLSGDEANWDNFNNNHRFAIAEGDQTVTLDTEYQLVKVNGTIKLAAGKYNVSVTKDFKMTIKDATTDGINAVAAEKANNVIFNLNGQRVMNAQKGLYIINGKKVVMK